MRGVFSLGLILILDLTRIRRGILRKYADDAVSDDVVRISW